MFHRQRNNIWPATRNGGQLRARSGTFNWFSFVTEECAFIPHSVAMELLIEQLPWALEELWWTRLKFCSSQATLEWEELLNTVKRVLPVVPGCRLNIYFHAVCENSFPAVKLGLFAGMLSPSSVSCHAHCCYLTTFKRFKGVLRTWPPSGVSVYSTCWGSVFFHWNMTSVMSSCMIKCCVDICRFDTSRHAGMCSVPSPTAL